MIGVQFSECTGDVIDVGLDQVRAHPCVRIVFAFSSIFSNADRGDALGHYKALRIRLAGELVDPVLQAHAVGHDQVSVRRSLQVRRSGVVTMNLGTWLGQGINLDVVAAHVLSDVSQHGECSQCVRLLVFFVS